LDTIAGMDALEKTFFHRRVKESMFLWLQSPEQKKAHLCVHIVTLSKSLCSVLSIVMVLYLRERSCGFLGFESSKAQCIFSLTYFLHGAELFLRT